MCKGEAQFRFCIVYFLTRIRFSTSVCYSSPHTSLQVLKESCSYICWTLLDWVFVVLFTLEFGIRQFLYIQEGKNKEFWADPLNVIDFVAILPSYIELFQWMALDYPEFGPPDELILKLIAHGTMFWRDPWTVLDVCIVLPYWVVAVWPAL